MCIGVGLAATAGVDTHLLFQVHCAGLHTHLLPTLKLLPTCTTTAIAVAAAGVVAAAAATVAASAAAVSACSDERLVLS